jgi:hypothetical protein
MLNYILYYYSILYCQENYVTAMIVLVKLEFHSIKSSNNNILFYFEKCTYSFDNITFFE